MKLRELFLTQEEVADRAVQKLKGLKQAIEDGDSPEIHNASSTVQGPCWGDLEKLGYAEKHYVSDSSPRDPDPDMRAVWTYTGPNSITLLTPRTKISSAGTERSTDKQVLQSGDSTE
jgi:hypothetical protein